MGRLVLFNVGLPTALGERERESKTERTCAHLLSGSYGPTHMWYATACDCME